MSVAGTDAHAWLGLSFGWGYPATSHYFRPTYFVWPYFISTRVPYTNGNHYRPWVSHPSVLFPMSYSRYTLGPVIAMGEEKRLARLRKQTAYSQQAYQSPKLESATPEIVTRDQIPSIKTQGETN